MFLSCFKLIRTLKSKLPKIGIPLLPGDADITIDLQAVFDRCYDTALYARRVRYLKLSPVPALPETDERWAQELLVQTQPVAK